FTATQTATYHITVTPRTDTDAGAGLTAGQQATLTAPSGGVGSLRAGVDATTNVVTLTWDPSTVDWGTGTDPVLNVNVSGLPGASTCGFLLPATTAGCHFTATATTTYHITVTPHNS